MQSEKMKTMQTVQCLMAVPSENSVPFESINLLAHGSLMFPNVLQSQPAGNRKLLIIFGCGGWI